MNGGLRDLASQIRRTAADHPAYSQVASVVNNCCDHIDAVARIEECNRLLSVKPRRKTMKKLPEWIPQVPKPWNPAYREAWHVMTDNERRWSFLVDATLVSLFAFSWLIGWLIAPYVF